MIRIHRVVAVVCWITCGVVPAGQAQAKSFWAHLTATADTGVAVVCAMVPGLEKVAGMQPSSSQETGLSDADNHQAVAMTAVAAIGKLAPAAASYVLLAKTQFEEQDPPASARPGVEAMMRALDDMYRTLRDLSRAGSEAQTTADGLRLQGQSSSAARALRDDLIVYKSGRKRVGLALGRSPRQSTYVCENGT
jgi:hypothetical protein